MLSVRLGLIFASYYGLLSSFMRDIPYVLSISVSVLGLYYEGKEVPYKLINPTQDWKNDII